MAVAFFWAAFAKPKLVPGVFQNLGEFGLDFIQHQILRPMMGRRGDGFLPFLVALFFFVWIMNLMEIIPIAPVPADVDDRLPGRADAHGLRHLHLPRHQAPGAGRLLRQHDPRDVPPAMLVILAPVEILTYILVRPFTLAVRLFANMFAGHILLLMFTLATWYLFSATIGLLFSATSFILTIVLTAFELLIQALQAYIFTILTAQYIGGSLEAGH